ncbi:hypothetical protein B0J11DRAFT_601949 [Dendryphion nanum]|uniref:Uncharacterized protein n=1 Tax=Dendryphion nanum TaxID=256645 RepID=A0A9P9CY69_9PLEO|nr:hypothetical protein B0J11DRAFT_601949 [Dendryphion nanum]
MANIGKLAGALISGHNETTVALANLNFNFSLVRVEPPREFHGLGNSLSRLRRDKAEFGSSHRTARKLGALFEQLVPKTEHLLKVYGTRVSEISASLESKAKDRNSGSTGTEGAFRNQLGFDGTTIWAAATSSKSAIAMNLLACMLVKLWDADEATAIWADLPSHVAPLVAAVEEISVKELQEWDSSARAWLEIARLTKVLQYK